jgi:hypothetical protein
MLHIRKSLTGTLLHVPYPTGNPVASLFLDDHIYNILIELMQNLAGLSILPTILALITLITYLLPHEMKQQCCIVLTVKNLELTADILNANSWHTFEVQ